MSEGALLGLVKSVLGQLTSPDLIEFLLLWNSKKDLKKIRRIIETITCFIYDAEQRHSKEHFVKLWLSRLRTVLYDADDLFDAIAAKALRKKAMDGCTFKKEVTLFFSKSNQLGFVIKTAHEIKAIRECLDGIEKDISACKLQYQKIEEKLPHSVLERGETHSYVDNKEVIGRDKEKEDIISLLLCEDDRQQNLGVISVIGFGGLGKTTLAQFVYNDPRVQTGFDLRLWTCINYLSDLESVLVKILTSVLKSKPPILNLDQLQRELREKIEGKKYLLVVDDVWDENPTNWSRLKTLLNCGKIGSKVLITTRKTSVARCLDAKEPYYRLNVLSKESAWSLFVEMAFKDGKFDGDSELVSVGKQIIHKCGYVPLAISLIGRMLRYREKDKEEWLTFLEKEFAEVVSDDRNLMQVLKVSYNDLPLPLKHCFAYCSVYPKDHVFDKDELVRMWIALGFVEPHAKKSLEEVAEDYFFHLVDRCLFQKIWEYSGRSGAIECECKMHDLLHDLAVQVAGSESKCFQAEDLRDNVEMSDLRHISVTCLPNSSSFYSSISSHSKSLRTLRFIEPKHIEISSLELALNKFRKLRTLVLSFLNFEALPDSFGVLIHLRYLDLSHNPELTALPNSICKLYHLQTLLLTYCSKLGKLPSNLTKLVSLRHIFLKNCGKLDSMPSGFAALTTLVSLDRFIVHPNRGTLRCLGCLDQLGGMLKLELPVNGWTDCVEDAKKANMPSKYRLSGVSIKWINEVEEGKLTGEERKAVLEELRPHADLQYLQITGYISDKLPGWFSSLLKVKKLRLKSCSLEFLDISVRSGYLLPRLEVLELRDMHSLRGWWREMASPRDDAPTATVMTLPRVSTLEISDCRSLVENMPLFEAVENLTLNRVSVRLMNMLLCSPNAHRSPQCHDYIKLQVLILSEIEGLECFSEGSIKHLSALKELIIGRCKKLSWVSRRGLACLTSLEILSIYRCGGVRLEDEDYDERPYAEINNYNYGLSRQLRVLNVPWQCNLVREDLQFLTSLEELSIDYYEEHQVKTDNEDSECCGAMSWSGLKKLQQVSLRFQGMECCFPKWTLHLPCLQDLELLHCGEMNVDDWVAQQNQSNSLLELYIRSKEDLLCVHDIPWKLLPSLCTLEIGEKLSSIPDGIQQLTSLQRLDIWGSEKLKEIPKWMINLTSLQRLSLTRCSPELVVRCERERGVDWHLISHIPTIDINRIAKETAPSYSYKAGLHSPTPTDKDNNSFVGHAGESLSDLSECQPALSLNEVTKFSAPTPTEIGPVSKEYHHTPYDADVGDSIAKETAPSDSYEARLESPTNDPDKSHNSILGHLGLESLSGLSERQPALSLNEGIQFSTPTPTEIGPVWKEYHHTPSYAEPADEQYPPSLPIGLDNPGTEAKRLQLVDYVKEGEAKRLLFLFGDSYEFEKQMIIQLWMALGLLSDEPMEVTGAYYFDNLVSQGYLLCSVANSLYKVNLEKLVTELNVNSQNYIRLDSGRRNSDTSPETLHASVVCDEINASIFQTLGGFKKLRTLLFLGNHGTRLQQVPRHLFLCYESLEALDLSGTHIKELPSSAGKMINLRYLDLSWTFLEALPERIDRFKKLQTLKLEGCSRLRRLPDEMKGLIDLRHLHLDVLRELAAFPEGMGALVNIRTLSAFPVGTQQGLKISELKHLNHITGSFCIAKIENVQSADEAKEVFLNTKRNIKKLKLKWSNYKIQHPVNEIDSILQNLCPCSDLEEIQIVCYPGSKLPDWIADVSFDKLVSITLFGCVRVSILPSLEKLHSLASLELISLNSVTKMDFKGGVYTAFPKLQKLSLDGMLNLQTWVDAQEGDYPCLVELSIKDCPKLVQLPSFVYVPILKHLEVSGCTNLALVSDEMLSISLEQLVVEDCPLMEDRCCKDGGQDWHKIQHVPTIWINQVAIQSIKDL